ncbi:hypothetical protein [Shewanella sp. M-Br]|uniref:hypothetical protein n=1 Tax=Shewanella sp. M-Br TaxID=2495595 RepID=UPI00294A4C71|nr:hypothetical protein SMBr_07580 [Shewanella sp. M-Br]
MDSKIFFGEKDKKYYPFCNSSKLHPLFDDKNLLLEFYISAGKKKDLKAFCKKNEWNGKPLLPRVVTNDVLATFLKSICNSSDARNKLSKCRSDIALYQVIYLWFKKSYPFLYEQIQVCCYCKESNKSYLNVGDLHLFFEKKDIDFLGGKEPILYLLLAFAMLQSQDRLKIYEEICARYPEIKNPILDEGNVLIDDKNTAVAIVSIAKSFLEDVIDFKATITLLSEEIISASKKIKNSFNNFIKLNLISDFIEDEVIGLNLSEIELSREIIKDKFKRIKNVTVPKCEKCDSDVCHLGFLSSWESITSDNNIDDFENICSSIIQGMSEFIDKLNVANSEILEFSFVENELLEYINEGNINFSMQKYLKRSCDSIQCSIDYRKYIDSLNLTYKNKLRFDADKIKDEIDGTIKIESDIDPVFLESLNAEKNKLLEVTKFSELIEIRENINEIISENKVSRNKIILSSVNNFENIQPKEMISICKKLIEQEKPLISFLLICTSENFCADYFEQSIGLLIESCCSKNINNKSLATFFYEFCISPQILSIDSDKVSSNDMLERIVVMLIGATFAGYKEYALRIFLSINAIDKSRYNFPLFINDIIKAIVSHKNLKIIKSEVLNELNRQRQLIKEKVAFDDGRFRHIQRNSKHYSRFESVCVYPALVELMEKVLLCIDNKNYISAHELVDDIDTEIWYQKLMASYDKSLIQHHHFSNVTQSFMAEFIQKIIHHLNYCENELDVNYVAIDRDELFESLNKWSGSERARLQIVNQIKMMLLQKEDELTETPLWDIVIRSKQIISSCPSLILLIREQQNPELTLKFRDKILSDLSNSIPLDAAKVILERESSWEALSILFEENEYLKSKYISRHNEALMSLNSRLKQVGSIEEREASVINECLNGGRLVAVETVINSCYEKINKNIEVEKVKLNSFVADKFDLVENVKELVSRSNMPITWQESIYKITSKIEMQLRRMKMYEKPLDEFLDEKTNLGCAVDTLKIIVETNSQYLDEVEFYLSPQKNDQLVIDYSVKAKEKLPDLVSCWQSLTSNDFNDDTEISKTWAAFVKGFAKISNLYHDEHGDKTRFGIVRSASIRYKYQIYQSKFYKPQSEFLKRPIRLYLYRSNVDTVSLKILEEELLAEESAARLHIVFAPQSIDKLKRYFKYNNEFQNFLIVDESFLYKLCIEEKHEVPLRQALHASVSDLANSSPFVAQGYCHQTNNIYVGRKDILKKLLNNPQAMIWGGRRIGKTSVLHALGNALLNRSYKVAYVYVDIQDDGDPDFAIAKKIAHTLELGNIDSIADLELKVSNLTRGGVKVAFLIDEVDEYIKKSRLVHKSEFPLATMLRQLVMADSSKDTFLVYSGYHQLFYEAKLDQQKRRVGHPFINIAQEIPIRDLTNDDVTELVKTGFEDMLGIKVSPQVPRLIAEKASRHPAFVQQFCRCLLEYVSNRRVPNNKVTISTDDVEAVYSTNVSKEGGEQAFIFYVNETLGYNLSHLGRAIMLALADFIKIGYLENDGYFTVLKLHAHLNEWCLVVNIDEPKVEHFEQTIELLKMTNMLTQDPCNHDKYRPTYPTYLDILTRLDKIGKSAIEDSLKAYDSSERTKGILL